MTAQNTHTYTFPLPPTLNEQINSARSNRYKSAKDKKNWTSIIAAIAHNQRQDNKWERFTVPVWVEFTWHLNSRKYDPDNVAAAAKYVMDGLILAKILRGDSLMWINSPIIHWYKIDTDIELQIELKITDYCAFF